MPPQVVKNDVARPITQNASEEVQEVKSPQIEKKSTEKQENTPKNEAVAPRQATAKEKSDKKRDVATGADNQRRELDRKLNDRPHTIMGTSGNDNIHVSNASGLLGKLGLYEVDVNGSKQFLTGQQLENSVIKAGAGNDRVVVDSNVKKGVRVDGGSGNDLIVGGSGNDRISGGEGNDRIFGRGGNDRLEGGQGNDTIRGGEGFDYIDGGKGLDYIDGGNGFDSIKSDRDDRLPKSKKK